MSWLSPCKALVHRLTEWCQDAYLTSFPPHLRDAEFLQLCDLTRMFGSTEPVGADYKQRVHAYFTRREHGRFYFHQSEKATIRQHICRDMADKRDRTLQEAQAILRHTVPIFGNTYDLGTDIQWSVDLFNHKPWLVSYYKHQRMYRGNPDTDILYSAKLHWQQYLVTLARAYLLSGELPYAHGVIAYILDWIRKNPYQMGIGWSSPLGASLRVLSWIWSLQLLDLAHVSPEDFWEILKAIYLHIRYIAANMSEDWGTPNNHLIVEAVLLSLAGILFPEFLEASQWQQRGLAIAERELTRQFFAGGIHKEQAFGYHLFVMDLYTHLYVLCDKHHLEMHDMRARVHAMYRFVQSLAPPGQALPMWGDSSELVAVHFGERLDEVLPTCLALGAALFHDPLMKYGAEPISEKALWLLGEERYLAYKMLPPEIPRVTSMAYPEAGLGIMRDGWQPTSHYLAVDCGPQGLGPAGHGHADMLSVEVYANGQKFLSDAGTFRYNGAPAWRHYFRGTSAHNTIVVDQCDQAVAEPSQVFGWTHIARPTWHTWYTSKGLDYFVGSHDGYERLSAPIRHQRTIFFVKGAYWVISDRLTGTGRHTYTSFWHLMPVPVALSPLDHSLVTQYPHANLQILPAQPEVEASLIEGAEHPVQGWLSPQYGQKIPAPTLQYTLQQEAPAFFDLLLHPFIGTGAPHLTIQNVVVYDVMGNRVPVTEARCLTIQSDAYEDYCFFAAAPAPRRFADWTTESVLVYIRKQHARLITRIEVADFRRDCRQA